MSEWRGYAGCLPRISPARRVCGATVSHLLGDDALTAAEVAVRVQELTDGLGRIHALRDEPLRPKLHLTQGAHACT